MASLSRNTLLSDAYGIDLCFDLDDALTLPGNEDGYRTSSITSPESDSAGDASVADLPTVAAAEGVICSVCVEGFRAEEEGGGGRGKQVPCGHVYHETCIAKWLSHSNSCPLCRSTVFHPHQ